MYCYLSHWTVEIDTENHEAGLQLVLPTRECFNAFSLIDDITYRLNCHLAAPKTL
jgi:hypothetical protein